VGEFLKEKQIPVFWSRKNRTLDLKEVVETLSFVNAHTLKMVLRSAKGGSPRPEEVLDFICGWAEGERPRITVQKLRVHFKGFDLCPTRF
jgi:hypothetical protein